MAGESFRAKKSDEGKKQIQKQRAEVLLVIKISYWSDQNRLDFSTAFLCFCGIFAVTEFSNVNHSHVFHQFTDRERIFAAPLFLPGFYFQKNYRNDHFIILVHFLNLAL